MRGLGTLLMVAMIVLAAILLPPAVGRAECTGTNCRPAARGQQVLRVMRRETLLPKLFRRKS